MSKSENAAGHMSPELTCYPKCEDCVHGRNGFCYFASPFLARFDTQRKRPTKPKSLNCGIEGKNFTAKDNAQGQPGALANRLHHFVGCGKEADMNELKHIEDCELGENWKDCPACVDQHNSTCKPSETLPVPDESNKQL